MPANDESNQASSFTDVDQASQQILNQIPGIQNMDSSQLNRFILEQAAQWEALKRFVNVPGGNAQKSF